MPYAYMRDVCDANRLAGAVLLVPVVNYWWSGFPSNLSKEAYHQQPWNDRWTLRVVHHVPWLTYWWNTQKLFPSASVLANSSNILSHQDKELITSLSMSRKTHVVCT